MNQVEPEKMLSSASDTLQNIPAFFPYEAKQALLRELSRKDRRLPVQEANAAAEVLEEVEELQNSRTPENSGAQLEDPESNYNFFYAPPVMEFKLANGHKGSVGQTPRK